VPTKKKKAEELDSDSDKSDHGARRKFILQKQGIDPDPDHTITEWTSDMVLDFRESLIEVADELDTKKRRSMPTYPEPPPAAQRSDPVIVKIYEREYAKVDRLIETITAQRKKGVSYLCKRVSREIYKLAKASYPELDSAGDIPKTYQAIENAYLKDVPFTTYEMSRLVNKLRSDFSDRSMAETDTLERNLTTHKKIIKTAAVYGIEYPEQDQARDWFGSLNGKFAFLVAGYKNAELKYAPLAYGDEHQQARFKRKMEKIYPKDLQTAYDITARYVFPTVDKDGISKNVNYATFLEHFAPKRNFYTGEAESKPDADSRPASKQAEDFRGRPGGGRGGRGGKWGRYQESRGATDRESRTQEEDWGQPPGPCKHCNQHLLPDMKDDPEKWHWKQRCLNMSRFLADHKKSKADNKKSKEEDNLATLAYRTRDNKFLPVHFGDLEIVN
jgi:hypothetical protein